MQKIFSLFEKKDVDQTVAFFRKDFKAIEDKIREIEVDHLDELKKDKVVVNLTKLVADVVASEQTGRLKRIQEQHMRLAGLDEFRSYMKAVNERSARLYKILETVISSNKKFVFKLNSLKYQLETLKQAKGKSVQGLDNMLQITVNQLSWRENILRLFCGVYQLVGGIVEASKEHDGAEEPEQRLAKLKELQVRMWDIIKAELEIDEAETQLENLDENQDSIAQRIEEYYFKTQTVTVDTDINRRRQEKNKATENLIAMIQSVNVFMAPIFYATMKYPRLMSPFAEQNKNQIIVELRKENQALIKESTVQIKTGKGYFLEGTYFEKEGCSKVIVILHEVTHGKFHQLIDALEYRRECNVLLYDNSGHFGSGGHTGLGLEEVDDFMDVLDWLIDEKKNTSIGVYGISLGGATAIAGIARYPRQDYVKAAVFQAAFADRDEVIRDYRTKIYKMPDGRLTDIMIGLVDKEYHGNTKFTPKEEIGNVRCPILLIHDVEDPWMSFSNAEQLAKNVRSPLETYFHHGIEHYDPRNSAKRGLVMLFMKRNLRLDEESPKKG